MNEIIQFTPIKEAPWQNELDAKKYLTQVEMEFKKILGSDFKLANFNDQDREFIMSMVSIGIMAVDITPNPDIGHSIKEMDFIPLNTLAVLKFNLHGNMIVDRILNWQNSQEQENKESDWLEKFSKAIKGNKKPTKTEEQ